MGPRSLVQSYISKKRKISISLLYLQRFSELPNRANNTRKRCLHNWSLIGRPSMVTIRAPMVRSWTGWNLLLVNCKSGHDLPTPTHRIPTPVSQNQSKKEKKMFKIRVLEIEGVKYGTCVAEDDVLEKVVIFLSTP